MIVRPEAEVQLLRTKTRVSITLLVPACGHVAGGISCGLLEAAISGSGIATYSF